MGAAPPSSSLLIPPAAFQEWDGRDERRRGRKWVVVTRKGNPSLAVVLTFSSCCRFCGQGSRRGRMVCEKCELRGHIFGRRRLGKANWSSSGTLPLLFFLSATGLRFRPLSFYPFDHSFPPQRPCSRFAFRVVSVLHSFAYFLCLPQPGISSHKALHWLLRLTDPQGWNGS